jgi:hypothetical protein
VGQGRERFRRHDPGQLSAARAALAAWAAMSCACFAQSPIDLEPKFKRPEIRRDADETFVVAAPRQVDLPCVAVDVVAARVLVSRKLLDALAGAPAVSAQWKNDAQRMAMIRGDRARELLARAKPGKGIECAERASGISGNVQYLVGELLVSGNAAVVDEKGARVTEKFRVNYRASAAGGFITYYLDRGEVFLSYTWFVT